MMLCGLVGKGEVRLIGGIMKNNPEKASLEEMTAISLHMIKHILPLLIETEKFMSDMQTFQKKRTSYLRS